MTGHLQEPSQAARNYSSTTSLTRYTSFNHQLPRLHPSRSRPKTTLTVRLHPRLQLPGIRLMMEHRLATRTGVGPSPACPTVRDRSILFKFLENTVTIIAGDGPQQSSFAIHQEMLCNASPFFRAACSAGWMDPKNRVITLPEDDPEVIKMMIFWIYEDSICVSWEATQRTWTAGKDSETELMKTNLGLFIQLYVLAEKYQMPSLQNDALSAIVWRGSYQNQPGILQIVPYVYRNTYSSQSALRRLIVKLIITNCGYEEIRKVSSDIDYPLEFLQEMATWLRNKGTDRPLSEENARVTLSDAFYDEFYVYVKPDSERGLYVSQADRKPKLPMISW